MATRTARTTWTGTLQEGSGRTELTSSGLGTYDVSWAKRTSNAAEGSTSPEELIAAAHASCFSMALSGVIAKAGGTPKSLDVTADVDFGPDEERGGFMISKITLKLEGEVGGLDAAAFEKAAQEAKVGCPVSKALAATDIALEIKGVRTD
jgi:osmotically inducible protein OsmC